MPDRSSDGSGSKTKGHTITLIHGLYDQGVLIDLYGRLIPAAGQDQTPTSRRSQLKSDMLNFKILGVDLQIATGKPPHPGPLPPIRRERS